MSHSRSYLQKNSCSQAARVLRKLRYIIFIISSVLYKNSFDRALMFFVNRIDLITSFQVAFF